MEGFKLHAIIDVRGYDKVASAEHDSGATEIYNNNSTHYLIVDLDWEGVHHFVMSFQYGWGLSKSTTKQAYARALQVMTARTMLMTEDGS